MDLTFERLSTIRNFYTFLGNIIEMDDQNDEDELEFLSDYLNNYNDQFLKWYETRTEATETSEDSESDENSDEESDCSSVDLEPLDLQSYLKMNQQTTQSNFNQESNEIPQKTVEFIENDINIDNIILYKKDNSQISRCENYLNSINQY